MGYHILFHYTDTAPCFLAFKLVVSSAGSYPLTNLFVWTFPVHCFLSFPRLCLQIPVVLTSRSWASNLPLGFIFCFYDAEICQELREGLAEFQVPFTSGVLSFPLTQLLAFMKYGKYTDLLWMREGLILDSSLSFHIYNIYEIYMLFHLQSEGICSRPHRHSSN